MLDNFIYSTERSKIIVEMKIKTCMYNTSIWIKKFLFLILYQFY